MIYIMPASLLGSRSPGEGEVVQACNAEHGGADALAFETAVAQDPPVLHAGERDACSTG